jgi:hypothetical protein
LIDIDKLGVYYSMMCTSRILFHHISPLLQFVKIVRIDFELSID